MKRICILLLIVCLAFGSFGCHKQPKGETVYAHERFSAALPDGFVRCENANMVAFAPGGDPVRNSMITFYATDLNWYFDSYGEDEYAAALAQYAGFDTYELVSVTPCTVNGYNAQRVECSVYLDQGTHTLVLYALEADMLYLFTLLNRDTDDYVDDFDAMMSTIVIHEA